MKNNRQKKDSELFLLLAYVSMTMLTIGMAIGRIL